MDPTEALDLDDSDLFPVLRPCKRPHSTTAASAALCGTSVSPSPDLSSIRSSSEPSFSLPLSRSQTLDDPYAPRPAALPEAAASSPRLIPGPAGAVQSAMHRKALIQRTRTLIEDPIPTQEYIRRAVEEGAADDDEDFSRDPWISAVGFLHREGLVDGGAIGTPISSIRACSTPGKKVAQIVAIIKSCSPNGFGDLMVTLKDPTGSIGASLHHKVVAEGEFKRDICVGSVLILQKVAVFSPSRRAHYLNITRNNVIKVFSKDAPLCTPNSSALLVKTAAPECSRRTTEECFPLEDMTDGARDNVSRVTKARLTTRTINQIESLDEATEGSSRNNRSCINQNAAVDMKSLMGGLNGTRATKEVAIGTNSVDTIQMDVDGNNVQAEGGRKSSSTYCNTASTNVFMQTKGEVVNINGAGKRQPVQSRGPMPGWTDEQLDVLSLEL